MIVQFVYSNSFAWYGARLASNMLANYGAPHGLTVETVPLNGVTSSQGSPAFLLSFLTNREFYRIFSVLEAARIPRFSKDRWDGHPVVIAGGAACFQPEPIADFVDVFCIGDGEDFLMALPGILARRLPRPELIRALSELPGAYVPAWRKITYDETGLFVKDMTGQTDPVLGHTTSLWMPPPAGLGKNGKLYEIELARGCDKHCAFCAITWRNEHRERPLDDALAHMENGKIEFFAPNTGGVTYFRELLGQRAPNSKGDITVDDFLRLPYPEPGAYDGHRYTFGVEGITPRLRRLVGKPISALQLEQIQERLVVGHANHLQLYFIRGIPGEKESDWDYIEAWLKDRAVYWREVGLPTEVQFTPLTKQAQTPLQYFAHNYDIWVERRVMSLVAWARAEKKNNPDSKLYITPSLRATSWARDVIAHCSGRNGKRFLWAMHKGAFRRLKPDRYPGAGLEYVYQVARGAGLDPEVIIGDWPFDSVLPWSHILPAGGKLQDNMLRFAQSIRRRLDKLDTN